MIRLLPLLLLSAAARGEVLLEETFDGPALPAGYVALGGEWSIVDGVLRGVATQYLSKLVLPLPPQADVAIEADVAFLAVNNNARWMALQVRGEPGALEPFLIFTSRFDRTLNNGIEIGHRTADAKWQILHAGPARVPPAVGEAHRLRFEIRGDLARGYIDGVLVAQAWVGATGRETGDLALVINESTVTFDNLKVESLPPLTAEERMQMLLGERSDPLVIGHRGASMHYPENTLRAFREALEAGADLVECDLQISSDGVVVVMHDKTVDRTTEGTGPVAEKTVAELKQLEAGAWKDEQFRGEPVPTFAELLALARELNGALLMDLKTEGMGEAIWRDVVAAEMEDHVIAGPWTTAEAARWREQAPLVPCFHIGSAPAELPGGFFWGLRQSNVRGFNYNGGSLTAEFVRGAHLRGMSVFAWTINAPDDMERMVRLGVDGILTDDPVTCLGVIQGLRERLWGG